MMVFWFGEINPGTTDNTAFRNALIANHLSHTRQNAMSAYLPYHLFILMVHALSSAKLLPVILPCRASTCQ